MAKAHGEDNGASVNQEGVNIHLSYKDLFKIWAFIRRFLPWLMAIIVGGVVTLYTDYHGIESGKTTSNRIFEKVTGQSEVNTKMENNSCCMAASTLLNVCIEWSYKVDIPLKVETDCCDIFRGLHGNCLRYREGEPDDFKGGK